LVLRYSGKTYTETTTFTLKSLHLSSPENETCSFSNETVYARAAGFGVVRVATHNYFFFHLKDLKIFNGSSSYYVRVW
jgi:hypothetical protein